ncbi:hypothetical protein E4479_20095 [Shigella flexneri]|nr:hypothetical protein [Shigella flexneri]EFX2140028.1 hypothetical protein [Shigella flexneri]
MRSNGPEGGGQDARHKLPDIKSSKKAIRKDGLFAFRTNIKVSVSPPHCRVSTRSRPKKPPYISHQTISG